MNNKDLELIKRLNNRLKNDSSKLSFKKGSKVNVPVTFIVDRNEDNEKCIDNKEKCECNKKDCKHTCDKCRNEKIHDDYQEFLNNVKKVKEKIYDESPSKLKNIKDDCQVINTLSEAAAYKNHERYHLIFGESFYEKYTLLHAVTDFTIDGDEITFKLHLQDCYFSYLSLSRLKYWNYAIFVDKGGFNYAYDEDATLEVVSIKFINNGIDSHISVTLKSNWE